MKRRDVLESTAGGPRGGAALAVLVGHRVSAAIPKVADLRDSLETDNPEVLALAQRLLDKCVTSTVVRCSL